MILAGDIGRAIKLCSAANAPLARIVKAGLMKVNRPDAEVQAAMDESALRVFDVSGRAVVSRDVGSLGAGRHRIDLGALCKT